jgi:hypothetical protein
MNDWGINPYWSPGSDLPKYNDPSRNPGGSKPSTETWMPSATSSSTSSGNYGGPKDWNAFSNIMAVVVGVVWGFVEYQYSWIQFVLPLATVIALRLVVWMSLKRGPSRKRNLQRLAYLPLIFTGYIFLSGLMFHRGGSQFFGLSLYSWSFPICFVCYFIYRHKFMGKAEKKAIRVDGDSNYKECYSSEPSHEYHKKLQSSQFLYKWSKEDLEKVKSNVAFMTEATLMHAKNYQYGSEAVRADAAMALKVLTVGNHSDIMQHASKELLNNEDFLFKAISVDPFILQYCTESMKDNFDIVKTAILKSQYGSLLNDASKRLLGNKELVLLAYQYPDDLIAIFGDISLELQSDPDVIAAAKKAEDLVYLECYAKDGVQNSAASAA